MRFWTGVAYKYSTNTQNEYKKLLNEMGPKMSGFKLLRVAIYSIWVCGIIHTLLKLSKV